MKRQLLTMFACLFAAFPIFAAEVVASAAGGWFAVDARAVKDTTWEGGAIVGGETNVLLQSSPNAWGEVGGGTSATITWKSTSGNSGTVAEATTAETVLWTPEAPETRFETNTLTYVSGSAVKTAQFAVILLQPAVPVLSPASGTTFLTNLTVSMTCASKDATIHYTTNGLVPTLESPTYKKFKIYGRTTVKAIAFWEDGTPGDMAVAEYAKWRDDPVIRPADGTVFEHSGQRVSITREVEDGILRYTTDGSDPTDESAEYVGPFTIDETTTVKAKVFGDQCFDSNVMTATLTRVWLTVPVPVVTAQAAFTGSQQRVSLACETEGAVIRYTTDGSTPTLQSPTYDKPFYVTNSCTIKTFAVMDDCLDSDIATFAIERVWGIGDTMGKPDHTFETGGDAGFVRVDDETAALGESMKSGAIGNSEKSILSTKVVGPGTLTFKWKASCEMDDEYEWDHGEFRVDGELKGQINGVTDWIEVSQRIEGDGEHMVTWTYVKDDNESVEPDCIWVSEYKWASDLTETQTTEVPVPYDWLKEKSRDIVDEYENYEKVAKQAAYNPRYTVEQCYVAGLDPESTTNAFTAAIVLQDGVPVVTWTPDLEDARTYKVWGKETLETTGDWQSPTNALHRFFKVTVEMRPKD